MVTGAVGVISVWFLSFYSGLVMAVGFLPLCLACLEPGAEGVAPSTGRFISIALEMPLAILGFLLLCIAPDVVFLFVFCP